MGTLTPRVGDKSGVNRVTNGKVTGALGDSRDFKATLEIPGSIIQCVFIFNHHFFSFVHR